MTMTEAATLGEPQPPAAADNDDAKIMTKATHLKPPEIR